MSCNKALESIRKILNFSIKSNVHSKIFDKRNCSYLGVRSGNKIKAIQTGNGQCVAEMVVEEQHTNGYGTLHGGFTAAAVDYLSSLGLLTHPRLAENIGSLNSGVSVDIHVSYLNAAKIGDKIVINSETVKFGRNLAFLKVTLFRKDDNVILAQGSHTKFVG